VTALTLLSHRGPPPVDNPAPGQRRLSVQSLTMWRLVPDEMRESSWIVLLSGALLLGCCAADRPALNHQLQ